MRFLPTSLAGAVLLEQERHPDARGFFARTWCRDELAAQGLDAGLAQASVSFNHRRGTLRGLHYQAPPHAEVKLVRCTRGALFDVAVDLRPDSPGFLSWVGVELTAENGRALYIPKGFAHGFYTLADATEVEYLISTPYAPDSARAVRFDDPLLGIRWPGPVEVIAPRDRDTPPSARARFEELKGL
ncbi:MAG TPA: dTDP-4-dehydrorhamnose 3,5-epimerase [Myxococcaceae bacterium]|jgi:dTDP-4-dehydrorhamnose 3,5-epimerase|nr:dTDP-4-dehydrorhamnose 3,5-epimerase [Myxococcaceae bacterium]